jgi:uncharacterized protein (TIGR03435 family)
VRQIPVVRHHDIEPPNFWNKPLILASDFGAIGLAVLIGALNASVVRSQSHASPRIAFEVASIRPSKPNDPRRSGMEFLPGGRFRSANMPLLPILATAYNVPFQSAESLRIKGVPDWILTERYDIEAMAEKGLAPTGTTAKARNEELRLMLQSVLADRLKLRMRRETVEMPTYALIVGPHGPKLEKAKSGEQDCTESAPFGGTGCHQFLGGAGRGIRGAAVDMSDLATYVSNWTDVPVVDQTGLKGLYTIQTEGWATTLGDDQPRPSLFAIFDQLGLKLVSKKGPVEIFVIEHVERPSEN